ncbi:MAG: hypothetical protein WC742_12080 [Gallionellaceae bacterium]|jgi:hypothetical protein
MVNTKKSAEKKDTSGSPTESFISDANAREAEKLRISMRKISKQLKALNNFLYGRNNDASSSY